MSAVRMIVKCKFCKTEFEKDPAAAIAICPNGHENSYGVHAMYQEMMTIPPEQVYTRGLNSMAKEIHDLKGKRDSLETENKNLKGQLTAKEAQIKKLEERIKELEKEKKNPPGKG